MTNLYSPAEAAKLTNVSQKTLARWVREGVISSIKTLGGHNRYSDNDLRKRSIFDENS